MIKFFAKLRKPFAFITLALCALELVYLRLAADYGLAFHLEGAARAFATLIVLFGVFIRSWSAGIIMKREEIAVTGPYRFVRHPLYLGSIVIATGFALLIGDEVVLALMIIYFSTFYYLAIIDEEEKCVQRFGDEYREYMKNTGRLLPRFHYKSNKEMSFSFRRYRHNKGYMSLIYSLIGILLVDLSNDFDLLLIFVYNFR
ncbi:MAG: isoprenylcysteine carboxylmethyltransferase family protein [Planctomycetes bacterium]|nr:isoprenylcysteine carboxylmethyltransferase family protein [Planctomycetota bacterium]